MKRDKKKAAVFDSNVSIPTSRSYQLELLEESLRRNIIIALDTGSGKTHIAVLRIKAEVLERETRKVITFPWKILVGVTEAHCCGYPVVIMVRCAHGSPCGATERRHCDPYTRFRRIGIRRIRPPSMEGPFIMAEHSRFPPRYDHNPTSAFGRLTTWICQSRCRRFSAGFRRVSSYREKPPIQHDHERVLPHVTTARLCYGKRKLCSTDGIGVNG
jgi:hypothetical protein